MKKNDKEPIQFELADWLYSQGARRLLGNEEIGRKIREIRTARGEKAPVTSEQFYQVISKSRMRLEEVKSATLINVPRLGYKIALALSVEMAEWAMKNVKKTIMFADRTNRLAPMVDTKHIPQAIEKVFEKANNKIEGLSGIKKQFLLTWREMTKNKENSNVKTKDLQTVSGR